MVKETRAPFPSGPLCRAKGTCIGSEWADSSTLNSWRACEAFRDLKTHGFYRCAAPGIPEANQPLASIAHTTRPSPCNQKPRQRPPPSGATARSACESALSKDGGCRMDSRRLQKAYLLA